MAQIKFVNDRTLTVGHTADEVRQLVVGAGPVVVPLIQVEVQVALTGPTRRQLINAAHIVEITD